jgi:hypothetical protein
LIPAAAQINRMMCLILEALIPEYILCGIGPHGISPILSLGDTRNRDRLDA